METQTVEWKREWKDEFLKEIASFANTDGGVLKIGVDDDGKIVGIRNPKDVMKKISDTVSNKLGLYPAINVDESTGVITVSVEKAPMPVELGGRFYVRSGNTVHEAKGREYDRIVSKRLNISWIDQPMEGIDETQLDQDAIQFFKKKVTENKILGQDSVNIADSDLLTKLNLKVGDHITRAGVILFHPAPEDIIICSFTKVGMFSGSEILHQDVVGGPLVTRLDRLMEIISTKYLVRPITYDGWTRIENNPYPDQSLRECLVNALIHNDYGSRIAVQIRIWKDRMMISDSGGLPEGWTTERLIEEHKSEPVNPSIAYVFFLMGLIENWGRGIERIQDGYKGQVDRKVTFEADYYSFQVKMDAIITVDDIETGTKDNERKKKKSSDRDIKLLELMNHPDGASVPDMLELLGVTSRSSLSREYIRPMMMHGLIEYTIPEKPSSKKQRYRTTEAGRRLISRSSK